MNNCKNYQTKQKNVIHELLSTRKSEHLTAEQMLLTLEKNNTPVSKATLYRTLEQMVDNHELIKYSIDGSPSCYQYVECSINHEHVHFKCEICGRLIHIENPKIASLDTELEKIYGIKINTKKTVLYGKCDECR